MSAMGIWGLIRSDYLAHYSYKEELPARLRVLMLPRLAVNSSLHATILVRLIIGAPWWSAWVWRRLLLSWHAIDWARDSTVGEGLELPHPLAIVVGAGTELGRNVVLHHVVTISAHHGLRRWTPQDRCMRIVVEDGVVIFPHSVVLGEIRIGAGAMVGVDQLLVEDLPPGASYVGGKIRAPAGRAARS
jgi:serine O-acetyltransferase